MVLPGWDSLETVRVIAKVAGILAIASLALLVIFELIARKWDRVKDTFEFLAILALAVAVASEAIQLTYDIHKETLQTAHDREIATKAADQIQVAKEKADAADQRAQKAEQMQRQSSSELNDYKREHAPRTLSEKQKTDFITLLKASSPQELYFINAPDPETQEYAISILDALSKAGWKTSYPPYNWGTIRSYGFGIEVCVPDPAKPGPRGAVALQAALKEIGADAYTQHCGLLGEGQFAMVVGLQRPATPRR